MVLYALRQRGANIRVGPHLFKERKLTVFYGILVLACFTVAAASVAALLRYAEATSERLVCGFMAIVFGAIGGRLLYQAHSHELELAFLCLGALAVSTILGWTLSLVRFPEEKKGGKSWQS